MTVFLCNEEDIPEDDSRGFELAEGNIFAVKKDGIIYIYANRCPHLGIPLEWQEHQFLDSDKSLIQCSTHGALFKIENGECIAGPCLTQYLSTINYTNRDGKIFIDLPNTTKAT